MGNPHSADLSGIMALLGKFITYTASDVELYLDETEFDTESTSYEKQVEVTIPALVSGAELRVICQAKPNIAGKRVELKIYRNGAALSAVEEVDGSGWEIVSWDLSPFKAGDTVELWIKALDAPQTSYVRYFEIAGDLGLTDIPTWA